MLIEWIWVMISWVYLNYKVGNITKLEIEVLKWTMDIHKACKLRTNFFVNLVCMLYCSVARQTDSGFEIIQKF